MAPFLPASSIKAPQNVLDLLERLHERSLDQETKLKADRESSATKSGDAFHTIMRDKFIALDKDKAAFMYSLVRATGAVNVVEAGTSYGVSTIYLALAVGQNAEAAGKAPGAAKVIATEHEPEKAAQAKKHWDEAGSAVESWIELREGDLVKSLQVDLPTIDFVLFDIWTPMVLPTLKVLEQKLKPGAVILLDNVSASAAGYEPYFSHIKAEGSKYKTLTLPFDGGFEMTTYGL